MSTAKSSGKQIIALLLALITLLSVIPIMPVSAETLSDGKAQTVTIKLNETHYILETVGGTKLQGQSWTYTSDTGIQGPAYCINWGLAKPSETKKITITGKYTTTPQTIGAFANGYPQRSLEDFISINKADNPLIANLTREEYVAATQAAVWTTLGQLRIEGTQWDSGRDTLLIPTDDPSAIRAYEALKIILYNASFWTKPLNAGMHIRLGRTEAGNVLNIEDANGLIGAEQNGMYGIEKETIGGVEYYTRTFVASSATSTYKNNYSINLHFANAPTGTIVTNLDNEQLVSWTASGKTYWTVPTPDHTLTNMNENGSEYAGDFKVCIPVRNTPKSGNITFQANATITQFNIYFANNQTDTEQSFIIADPMYAPMSCTGTMKWDTVTSPYGRLVVNKVDGMGNPLQGAIFKLTGSNGKTYEGTSDSTGQIVWEYLDPTISYILSETQAPAGYIKAEDVTVNVLEGTTTTVSVKNLSERTLRIRKVDAQNGNPLLGASFRIEQTDGSYKTDLYTGHNGCIELQGDALPYGTYKAYELKAPVGYEKSNDVQTFKWDGKSDITLTFENVRTPSFVLIKKDKDTNIPLEDVSFKVYRDGRLVTTVTTNSAGYAYVSELSEGYYEVEEVAAPAGYILDTERHGIYINPYDPAVENDPILVLTNSKKPTLIIEKLDAQTLKPIKNIRFAVYKDTKLIGNYTTDADGLVELTNLEPGTYTVKETRTASGYVLQDAPQSIELEPGKTATLTFFNPTKPGISIKKIDADTGDELYGATFKIEGVNVTYLNELTTDRDGEITLSDLNPGVYSVSEISAPEGYVRNTEVKVFEATEDGNIQLVFKNYRKPTLKITKVDSDNGDTLYGAAFRIAKVGDATRYYDRVTDRNGVIEIDGLDEGIYTVQELSAPEGYQLNDTLYHVELFEGKDSTLTVENTIKPSLTIIKLDSKTNEPLSGAVFEVYRDARLVGTYTTNINGEINLRDLKTGTYLVKEISVDNEHIVNSTPQQIEIDENSGDTAMLVFLNDQKPYIRLVKLDSTTLEPLSDAVFEVKKTDGSFTKEFTTDRNGEISLSELEVGTYVVKETKAPDGYVADNSSRIVEVKGNESATFVFTNTVKPSIKINKIDKYTGEKLEGAVVRIVNLSGNDVWEKTTDKNGEIILSEIDEGVYTVQEITAPEGYQLNGELYHLTASAGKTNELTIENSRKPSLTIKKYDSLTGEFMAGTSFEVYLDTTLIGTYTTNDNGVIELFDLKTGTYTVKEIATDDDHIVNSTPQSIEVKEDSLDTAVLVFLNDQKPYMRLVKLDSQTMKPLANATFKFKQVGGTYEKEYTTDQNGEIKLDRLDEGTYTVTETKAPEGYLIDNAERTVKVEGNEYATFVFTNTKKPQVRVIKYDKYNDKYLSGATFRIAKIEDGSNYLDRITDIDGNIVIDNLEPGVYSVKEIKAPTNYVLNETEYHVELFAGKESQVVVLNEEKPSLKIVKTDAETGKPIAGVGFLVRLADGSTENTVVTDQNGEALLSHLNPGIYEVIEKSVPNDYLLDSEPKLVTLIPNRTSVVRFENYQKPSLTVNKIDSITKDPLKNAKFSVVYASNNTFTGEVNHLGTFTTDENGQFKMYNLNDGWYKITETAAPDGYVLSNEAQEIYIKGGEDKEITFENVPLSGLVIKKVDADTGKVLQGAKFQVRYLSGTSGSGGTVIGEYTTSANGTIVITRLEAGTYVIEETKAPDGYIISDAPETVYITGKEQDVITVTVENEKDGGLIIRKLDSITKQPLAGAEFTVTTSDGKFIPTENGAVSSNGIYTTDELGQIHITNIEAGTTVVVTETKAPDGYVIDTVSKTVKIDADDTQTLTFYNKPSSGLIITKLDKETKEPLYGAVFEITDSTGAVVGTSNGRYTTDIYGNIKVNGLTPGTYVITEVEAPAGYAISGEPQTINVVSGKIHNLTFYNSPEGGLIITKLDKATGEPLYGAVFKVTNSEGTVVGNANGRYTTNRNGIIHLTGLAPDTYVVTEVTAPEGYTLDSAPQTVKVKSGQTHELTFLNEALGGIRITKLDEETRQPIKGVKFEVEYMNGKRIGTYTTNASGVINIDDLPNGWYTVTETKAADDYILDAEPHDVEVTDGEITRVTITNRKNSSFLIHKVDSTTGKGISGVTFLISDRYGRPLAQYVSDQNGYVYTDNNEFEDGKYYIREIAVPNGYVLDNEVKTFYVEYGHTSSITWYNTPIQAQIQVVKKSADDNPINGLPAGSLLEGAVFEIYDKAGNIVDTIKTDKNGRAASKPLPLGLYTMRETVAPTYYTPNETLMTAHLEFNGQIMTFEVLNKSVSVGVSVTKYGYNEVMPNNPIVYSFKNIANTSSVSLDSFYFRDTLPSAIRAEKIVTGTFNQNLSYKIVYLTNLSGGEYRTINDNLSTSKNYVIDVSNIALGLADNEYITEIMYVFGSVRAGFAQVETPYLYARSVKGLANGSSFVNTADVGGVYNGQWITTISRFVTKVYSYTYIEMPKTGY